MKTLITILFISLSSSNIAQNYPSLEKLNIYKLGTHISLLDSMKFQLLDKSILENGTEYLIYSLDDDTSSYIVFKFPTFRKNYINEIQITGFNSGLKLVDDIHLGDTKEKVFKFFGPPSDSNFVESVSVMFYSFMDRNYTVEIAEDNTLYSIALTGMDGILEKNGWPETWFSYTPSSIAIENKKLFSDSISSSLDDIILLETVNKFRPRIQYLDQIRPIGRKKKDLLSIWAKQMSQEEFITRFENEIHIMEDSSNYWIPIQESLIEDFIKYSNNGMVPSDLFMIQVGYQGTEILMLINEFIIW